MDQNRVHIEPLILSPSSKDFRIPEKYILSLYEDREINLEGRGAVLVNVPDRFVHEEAPEIDQNYTLSWVVRQHLRKNQDHDGVWMYSDVQTFDNKIKVGKYLSKIDINRKIELETFWRTRQQSDVWHACFCTKPFFKNDETTFRNLPKWSFSNLDDMMEESDWGERTRNYFIGSAGSATPMTYEYAHLGYLHYMHWGAPRSWMAVPAKYFRVLQNNIAKVSPRTLEACKTLHTLSALYEPSFFERQRIPFVQYDQKEGQLLIVSYQVQYQAIDLGANVSENCNFAFKNWLNYAPHQVYCECPNAKPERGDAMFKMGLEKYMPGTKPVDIPDPTENGKWYCARSGLPRKLQGKSYEKTDEAYFGLDAPEKESSPESTTPVESDTEEATSSHGSKSVKRHADSNAENKFPRKRRPVDERE